MSNDVLNVLINVISSAITGSAVWLVQRALRRRKLRRKQRFFGLTAGADCLLVVNRQASSTNDRSVHRSDVVALLGLSALLKECDARAEVVFHDQTIAGFGRKAEFCLGGPDSNNRTVAHLRWGLPGATIDRYDKSPQGLTIRVGSDSYVRKPDEVEYVLLAKVTRTEQEKPVFVVAGQTAVTNQAAVTYLVSHHRQLIRAHGIEGRFCVILRVVDPPVYGANLVEFVRDATRDAFTPTPAVTSTEPTVA